MAVNINVPSQVKTYANLAAFPATGALKTIYIAEDTNKTYRWTGSVYVEVSASAASGITIGSTAIASGTVGRILFEGAGNVVQESSSLFWDNTNVRLGVGTSAPSAIIHSVGSVTASGSIARGNFFNNALVASANNDVLVGLDIQPTFTNGAFTGLENIPLRFVSQSNSNVVKNILLKNIGTGNGTGVSIGFNNINTNNLSHAFIKSYYVTPSGMAMSFGTGGGSSLTSEGTTALVLNADQTANFTARVIANSGGFQATGTTTNLLMSDNGTPVITRNGSTGIQFLKDAYWQTFSIFTNNTENLRVASTGNVLIGTTTDAGFKLDVNGTARATSYTLGNYIINQASANQFIVSNPAGASGQLFLYGGSTSQANIQIYGSSGGNTNNILFNVGSTVRSVIFGSTGNVGINTTTDAGFRLDVNGTARVQGNITQSGANTSSLGFITNGAVGVYSNTPTATAIGLLVGCVNNTGHTAIFTKGNNSGSTAIRITDQNVGTSINHFLVDFVGASGFGIANGTTVVNASAQVEIQSTTKGFLPPRMTTTQKNAIATPAAGLVVYDTTLNKLCVYTTAWETVTSL